MLQLLCACFIYHVGGRKLLELEDEMMVVARRIMTAENAKDYDPAQANPKHDPDLNPHDNPPPQAEPPRQTNPPSETNPPHETDPPRDTDPPHDPSGIYHHVHHPRHPSSTSQILPNIPAPAPITTINDGV